MTLIIALTNTVVRYSAITIAVRYSAITIAIASNINYFSDLLNEDDDSHEK